MVHVKSNPYVYPLMRRNKRFNVFEKAYTDDIGMEAFLGNTLWSTKDPYNPQPSRYLMTSDHAGGRMDMYSNIYELAPIYIDNGMAVAPVQFYIRSLPHDAGIRARHREHTKIACDIIRAIPEDDIEALEDLIPRVELFNPAGMPIMIGSFKSALAIRESYKNWYSWATFREYTAGAGDDLLYRLTADVPVGLNRMFNRSISEDNTVRNDS